MKRALSLALALILVLGMLPVSAIADAAGYGAVGSGLVTLSSDPDTSSVPAAFYTETGNGMVWTDKSVTADSGDSSFDVTLSAMAQEYKYSREELSNMSTASAADVLLILDLSQSMTNGFDDGTSTSRIKAMTTAVNEVMSLIMKVNRSNRIMVCGFSDGATTVLPLGSYGKKNGDGTYTIPDEYFQYSNSKFSSAGTWTNMSTGNAVSVTSQSLNRNTLSQYGIYYALNEFRSSINKESFDVQRTPFVLFMTDGEAKVADTNWTAPGKTGSPGNNNIAALTILSAAYQKQLALQAYNTRNNVKENKYYAELTDIEWFNVGIALEPVGTGTPTWMQVMMDPTLTEPDGSGTPKDIHDAIVSYATADSKYPAGFAVPENYRYTDSGYVTYAQTAEAVSAAFGKLGESVARLTSSRLIPITKTTSDADEDNVFITFTDTLGTGTVLAKNAVGNYDITLSLGGDSYTGVPKSEGSSVYAFTNSKNETLKSSAELSDTLVKWNVHSDDLPIIRFASRFNPGNAYDYDKDGTAEIYEKGTLPIRVSYTVMPTADGILPLTAASPYVYSNLWTGAETLGTATAVFSPSAANPYYYSGTNRKDAETAVAKSSNITETAADSSSFSWVAGSGNTNDQYVVNLGNNGRLQCMARISIKGSPETQLEGKPVGYAITLENLSPYEINDVKVTAELSGVTINSSDVTPDEGTNNQWTLDLPANDNALINLSTTASNGAASATPYKQTAKANYGGTASTATLLTVRQGYEAKVNTFLDGSALDAENMLGAGNSLYLKDSSGEMHAMNKTDTGSYVSAEKLPEGSYFIYAGADSATASPLSGKSITLSEGGDNTASLYWVTPLVTTKLDDVLTDIPDITGDTGLYLGGERIALTETGTGTYVSSAPILAADSPSDYFIYNGQGSSATAYGKVTVSASGTNARNLDWYTVQFITDRGTKPDKRIVMKSSTAANPGTLVDSADKYTFDGWYTTADYDTLFDFSTVITAPTSVFAKWHLSNIPVNYNGHNPGTMPKTDFSDSREPDYNTLVRIDPNVDGQYNGSYSVTQFNLTDQSGYRIEDPVANPGKLFAGWSVSYPETGVTLFTAQYYDDVKGNPDDPENSGDGVPDIFEKKLTYTIENGSWNADGTQKNDIVEYVPLTNNRGVYDILGTGTPAKTPANTYPDANYTSDSGAWSKEGASISAPPSNVSGTTPEQYDYKYSTLKTYPLGFAKAYSPEEDDGLSVVHGATVSLVYPDDAEYTGDTVFDMSDLGDPDKAFYEVPDPTRPDYTFNGWQVSVDPDGNVTLTALWKAKGSVPGYDGPDDRGDPKGPPRDVSLEIELGHILHIIPHPGDDTENYDVALESVEDYDSITNPKEPGKVFVGWEVSGPDEEGNYTLTAVYSPDVLGDVYDPDNKGDGVPDCFEKPVSYTVVNGTWADKGSAVRKQYVPLLDDFGRWSKTGTGTLNVPAHNLAAPDAIHTDDGDWEYGNAEFPADNRVSGLDPVNHNYLFDTLNNYTVNYNSNGQTDSEGKSVYYDADTKIYDVDLTLKTPSAWEGHSFHGWNENPNASADDPGNITLYVPNASATLYAVWSVNEHLVSYPDENGNLQQLRLPYGTRLRYQPMGGTFRGTTAETVVPMPDENIDSSPDPVRPGFTFIGWTMSGPDPYSGDITMTANWESDKRVEFTRFIDDDGDGTPDTLPDTGSVTIPYQKLLRIDPNGGTYNGTGSVSYLDILKDYTGDEMIGDPIPPEGMVFVGWRLQGPDNLGGYTLTAVYAPDDNGNGLADCFEKKLTYRVINGSWDGSDNNDIVSYVPLKNERGEYASNGKATLSLPSGMKEKTGFVAESGSWSSNRPADDSVTGTVPETFEYTFEKALVYFNAESASGSPVPDDLYIDYLHTLTVDPNGGTYRDSKNKTVYDPVSGPTDITDPVAPSGKAFSGWHMTLDSDGNVTLTAVYKNLSTAPKTGDSLHRALFIGLSLYFADALAFFLIASRKKKH